MKTMSTKNTPQEILEIAKDYGAEDNYLFVTTFERYQTQIELLTKLKETIDEDGAVVTKEYVKGRENITAHPSIIQYNKTTDSANKTATTLLKIIESVSARQVESKKAKLLMDDD